MTEFFSTIPGKSRPMLRPCDDRNVFLQWLGVQPTTKAMKIHNQVLCRTKLTHVRGPFQHCDRKRLLSMIALYRLCNDKALLKTYSVEKKKRMSVTALLLQQYFADTLVFLDPKNIEEKYRVRVFSGKLSQRFRARITKEMLAKVDWVATIDSGHKPRTKVTPRRKKKRSLTLVEAPALKLKKVE